MATREDELLIELALKNHLLSQEEAAECLSASTGDVGEVLISKGYVKERHVKSLRKKVPKLLAERPTTAESTRAAPSDVGQIPSGIGSGSGSSPSQFDASDATFVAPAMDSGTGVGSSMGQALFGQIAVHKGFLSEGDLKVALNYQETLPLPRAKIGEILVHYRRLTQPQVDEVLAWQAEWKAQLEGSGETLAPSEAEISTSGRGPSTPDDPGGLLGRTWKGYRVERILGKGGMGAVYRAVQERIGREVALKVMLRPPGRQSIAKEERERFVREARLVANLNHPNVVSVFQADLNDDFSWFTMELVPGKDFKQVLRSGTFPIRAGAGVLAKVARAMEFAHERGVIHRDLKPQNIMIDEESGEPKILDFGLAKNVDSQQLQQLTQMGAFLGTPAYMAPEQAGGDPNAVDRRADTYALGAILYEVLTGRPPFTGSSAINVIKKVLKEDPKPPQEVFAQAEPRLSKIALKALAKEPEARYQTAAELADDVEAVIGRVTRTLGDTGIVRKSEADEDEKGDDSGTTKGFFGRLFGG